MERFNFEFRELDSFVLKVIRNLEDINDISQALSKSNISTNHHLLFELINTHLIEHDQSKDNLCYLLKETNLFFINSIEALIYDSNLPFDLPQKEQLATLAQMYELLLNTKDSSQLASTNTQAYRSLEKYLGIIKNKTKNDQFIFTLWPIYDLILADYLIKLASRTEGLSQYRALSLSMRAVFCSGMMFKTKSQYLLAVKNHGDRAKGGISTSQRNKKQKDFAILEAKKTLKQFPDERAGQAANDIHEALKRTHKGNTVKVSTIKKWISPIFPEENKKPGRPKKL